MKRKSLRGWIRDHRGDLDRAVKRICPNVRPMNDSDRREWIMNDEGLYLWAKGEGVNI